MPSNKRGGLSKREFAAAAKASQKSSSRSSSKKSIAPLVGAGPLQPGQVRVGGTVTGAGPLLPNQTRDMGSQRSQAAKAQQRQNTPKSSGPSILSGLNGVRNNTPANPGIPLGLGQTTTSQNQMFGKPAAGGGGNQIPGGGGGLLDGLKGMFSSFGKAQGDRSIGMASPNAFLTDAERESNRKIASDNTLGIPGANASFQDLGDMQNFSYQDQPFFPEGAIGSKQDGGYLFQSDNPQVSSASTNVPWNDPTLDQEMGDLNQWTPERGRQSDSKVEPRYRTAGGDYRSPEVRGAQDIYSQQQNELFSGGPGPVDQASPQVTRQVRGSGLFGTGKGVGNPAADDPYIKELRKAYASNGGEKWLRKQFEELIAALDPTYAQMQREGTDALQAQLLNNNNQLASVMNANNVGDSEQRSQLMAGQQRDTTTALGNLLAKLAQNKAQDVSGYRSEQARQMGQLQDKNQMNRQRLLEQIQQYRQQQLSNRERQFGSSGVGAPKPQKPPSHNEIFNWAQDALNKGYSWQEIADNAAAQGIGTETGSYLDQLLNNANKQNRFAR